MPATLKTVLPIVALIVCFAVAVYVDNHSTFDLEPILKMTLP